jgi:hypothetical protein
MKNTLWAALLVIAAGIYLLGRLGRRWGATDDEVYQPFPGDTLVPHPMVETTHAITIHAAAREIWPWLVQAGYHRGGWYTEARWYAWLERVLWHTTSPSVDRILPEFQHLEVGDVVPDGPPGTAYFTVALLEPNHVLALYSTTHVRFMVPAFVRNNPRARISGDFSWVFVLTALDEHTTRLIVRARANLRPRLFRMLVSPLMPGDFIMARMMLQGIKQRAERISGIEGKQADQSRSVNLGVQ